MQDQAAGDTPAQPRAAKRLSVEASGPSGRPKKTHPKTRPPGPGRSRRSLKRALYLILAALVTLAVFLFIWLDRISTPPLTPKAGETPAKQGARAVWRWSLYGAGSEDRDQFFLPYQAAIDSQGRMFVTDTGNSRIMYFDRNRKYLGKLTGSSDGKVKFQEPLGVAFSGRDDLYIADRGISKIVILDRKFRVKQSVPEAIPIAPMIAGGRLYVANYDSIGVYNLEGKIIERWGKRGRANGEFDFPNGVVVANSGELIYVSDSNNHRIQAFSTDGDYLWSVGRPISTMNERPIEFDLPAGMARDEDGFLYVVDTFDASIRILDAKGQEVAVVGDYGAQDGLFSYPTSITYSGDRHFLIADRGNGRIQGIDIFPPSGIEAGNAPLTAAEAAERSPSPAAGSFVEAFWPSILLFMASLLALAAALVLYRGKKRA